MTWQRYSEFIDKIKVVDLSPVIAVYGSDRFLRKMLIDNISQKMGDAKKVEKEVFYANETNPEQVLASCQTYSMFASLKLVLLYQFQGFNASQRNQILKYLDNPNPASVLLLFADPPSDYFDEKRFRDWFAGASKKIDLVELSGITDQDLKSIIKQLAKGFDKRISEDAISLLLELTGSSPELLYQEIEKISLYLGEAKAITPEIISEIALGGKPENLFELAEALGGKDIELSLEIYRRMLNQKQSQEMILAIIKRHYRILLELYSALGSETMQKSIMDRFRIPKNLQRNYLKQAERFNERDLKKVFREFYETELLLKSSALERETIMERLLLRLCRI